MYTRSEASTIKRKFWTSFGLYLKPVQSASGEKINWLNYKTGIRNVFFRMDADNRSSSIAIEIAHTDNELRNYYFEKIRTIKTLFEEAAGKDWIWNPSYVNDQGLIVARIGKQLEGVNVFEENDWPKIISFLKPALISLDKFWFIAKDLVE